MGRADKRNSPEFTEAASAFMERFCGSVIDVFSSQAYFKNWKHEKSENLK